VGATKEGYSGEGIAMEDLIATLVGLTAVVIGLTGLFGFIAFKWDNYMGLIALALSLANITLGSLLFLTGLRRLWRP
jgi:membrane-bound metal-dependent hydrolase YbcI (DUF457 family)